MASAPAVPHRGLRTAVAASAAGKTVEITTLVLLGTAVPRALDPSDFGRFSVALTLVTIGSLVLTLGGPTLMARVVPAAPIEERVALARAIGLRLSRGRAVQVAVLAFGVLAVALRDPDIVTPLEAALIFTAFALNVATSLALQVALGLVRTVPWSLRYPLQNAVLIVAVLVLFPTAGLTGAHVAIFLLAVAAVNIDWAVPAVFGSDFAGATTAFGPALALLVLAPLSALSFT